ncbi:acyl-CoA ligase (AMP-forming), exosortase A system-associated [Endozoicomonas sp. SM1973]|uniref:Acyl-CoA ligase (AMP-forming), exosortase A system-associated n=1 Tax=Spartinivicinus marinus TaxID=2994442 RepID=A0A853I106_9GAMM|nr:acyl-CoA ligase (AMP-forming), exosortase A system-associated [Spartinivicinus marinus]MCX4024968.1 acyl-CoA ligase (AMP-forming), exosortase A system-associated [Spartinivicinus marinus]NYZ67660.1 acyl-CoA ligase (AMP-forming), exosortase A system-associated [Spartinivicinus marinus]
MSQLLHELAIKQSAITPKAVALGYKEQVYTYQEVVDNIWQVANGLAKQGLSRHERVAIYLPKLPETVFSMMGTSAAGGVFVPVNPILKPEQVRYILQDCNVRILITNAARLKQLSSELSQCHDLRQVVLIDEMTIEPNNTLPIISWQALLDSSHQRLATHSIDMDMAAILYTSGSTGRPKGVVLSHRNMVTGAHSVAEYLDNTPQDKILAVLPFSFDYGLSQLTTAFSVGACCYLMDYLLPRDVIKAVNKYKITGLAAVPPLWVQLADLSWPEATTKHLRYITNSGGAMPTATLTKLQQQLPNTAPYLMYGLTEAFRSSYLPPNELAKRPTSMGKAIPNAELLVINEAGEECEANEPGELVHRGSLVALGYWSDQARTQERFKPIPNPISGIPITEIAVWSGDLVKKDEEGFLYFIGRNDDMIKTSGYRVSPTEVEEVVYASNLVGEVAALGVPHPQLGQAIVLAVTPRDTTPIDEVAITNICKQKLPGFMVPQQIARFQTLPRNPNGKIDRKALISELSNDG